MVNVLLVSFSSKVQLQPANAKLPMLLTLGTSSKYSEVQPLNALSPISVKFEDKFTSASVIQSSNAELPII